MRAKVGIVGATGYVGSELVRWLLEHPNVEIEAVTSRSRQGASLGEVLPALYECTDLRLERFDANRLARFDAVLLATPHGMARDLASQLDEAGAERVLDLSADHRLEPDWVYGQPEWNGEALVHARRIAVPGCFATAIELAVAPFVAAGAVRGPVCVAAATGSTGSGATPKEGTHHPERFANLKAYKVLEHQHVPEIRQLLGIVGAAPEIDFVPLSAPVDRGIFATCFVPVDRDLDVDSVLSDAYAGAPLVRIRSGSPEIRLVRGTAFADVAVHRSGACAVALSAIDNLGKGAAAQAVQCLNIAMGWPEDLGLRRLPCTP